MKILLSLLLGMALAYYVPMAAVVLQGIAWSLIFMLVYLMWSLRD